MDHRASFLYSERISRVENLCCAKRSDDEVFFFYVWLKGKNECDVPADRLDRTAV